MECKRLGGQFKISIDDDTVLCSEESFVSCLMQVYCGDSLGMQEFLFDL